MRKQGSLKGEGTHRGNLCVHIFTQILPLKDIQRKTTKTPPNACRRPADIYLSTTDDFLLAFHTFSQAKLKGFLNGN